MIVYGALGYAMESTWESPLLECMKAISFFRFYFISSYVQKYIDMDQPSVGILLYSNSVREAPCLPLSLSARIWKIMIDNNYGSKIARRHSAPKI